MLVGDIGLCLDSTTGGSVGSELCCAVSDPCEEYCSFCNCSKQEVFDPCICHLI